VARSLLGSCDFADGISQTLVVGWIVRIQRVQGMWAPSDMD